MINLKQTEYVQRPMPVVQMISLIDILFINLSFFLAIFIHFNYESELNISVPKASTSIEAKYAPEEIIVNISKNGSIVVNRQAINRDDLAVMLNRMTKLYPGQAVIVRADQKTYHEDVVRVLDICAKARIWNISFATAKES